ncbi:MAG: hypothetical protein HKM93_14040 [Desulfobacteraceae bacterium]|nr:hypothetical protein [Desulfobacteraceae bacterium]
MADTEKTDPIKVVRDAEDAVTEALDGPGLTTTERTLLDDLSVCLRDLDTYLVMNTLYTDIAKLTEKSTKLAALNNRTRNQVDKIEKVAKTVELATDTISALTQATTAAASRGLL